MLKITSIEPQYRTDEKNIITVHSYTVSYVLIKKLPEGTIRLSGAIDTDLSINIEAIKGKIMFHLKDVIPTE